MEVIFGYFNMARCSLVENVNFRGIDSLLLITKNTIGLDHPVRRARHFYYLLLFLNSYHSFAKNIY